VEEADKKLGKLVLFYTMRLISAFWLGLALLFFTCNDVYAVIKTISDEETELYLEKLIQPIFEVANISFNRNKIFIIEDNSINAFVSDGNNLFIHTGVILQAQNSDEIRGVVAHETGHILGGHILRHKLRQQELQSLSLASIAIAGALGAISGRGDVAAAIALGSQGSLINKSLAYRIEEERNADEAAVSILKKAGYSSDGLLSLMKKIQQENKMQGFRENEYFRTHPISAERIAFLQQMVKKHNNVLLSNDDAQLARIKAKLYAFIKSPQQTYLKYPLSDSSINAMYAHAIVSYKNIQFDKAQKLINQLIKREPNNPHFRELKGQILFEQGKIREAKNEFSIATKLLPSSVLFKINEAQSVLEMHPSKQEIKNVIKQLQKALNQKQTLMAWLLLSRAYELDGQKNEALYAAAEYSVRLGKIDLAKRQAQNILKNNPSSQILIKTNDLLDIIENLEKQ